MRGRPLAALVLCVVVGACGDDSGARVPLGGDTGAGAAGTGTLSPDARAALEEGNGFYRAGAYRQALASYRRAAVESPADAAPLWGIQMAARALQDTALADSAGRRLREIAPDAGPGAGGDPHVPGAGAPPLPPDHPGVTGAPGGTGLPPNHPPVNAQGGRVSGSPR